MSDEKKNNVVRIAGVDVPVHLAWKKIEILNTSADVLQRLNETYPHLASDFTHEIVPLVRERMKDSVEDIGAPPKVAEDIVAYLEDKIQTESPADLVDLLKNEKGIDISLEDLIYFVGEKKYIDSMVRQAREFNQNRISHSQICELWNEIDMPAPGKTHWSVSDIEKLIGPEDFPVS
jgi:hypothetical protein